MQRIANPLPLFLDTTGRLLDGGELFVGVTGQDPESHPIGLFLDQALTVPINQPISILGGVAVNGLSPIYLYCAEADYSLRTRDGNSAECLFIASVAITGPQYQPLDSDLTAIAALLTTSFGRNLLTMANAAALKTAAGIVDGLATTGGTVTGSIIRSGGGAHLYHTDAALTAGGITVSAVGGGNPTSGPGAIWFGI